MSKKPNFDKTTCLFYNKGNCGIIVDVKKYFPTLNTPALKKKCSPVLPSCKDGAVLASFLNYLKS